MRTEGGDTGTTPISVVSTTGARIRAGKVTSAAQAKQSLLDLIDIIDQVQGQRPNPSILQMNSGKKPKGAKVWYR